MRVLPRALAASLVGALAVVVTSGCASNHERHDDHVEPSTSTGPMLVLTHGVAPGHDVETSPAIFALASLPRPALALLAETFDDLALDVGLAKNPMVEDLRDERGAPARLLRKMLDEDASRISVARALAAGRWSSADGEVSVRLVARCEGNESHEGRCVPLWPLPGEHDPEAERARFFAWPLAHAAVLRATAGETAQSLARHLRSADEPGASGSGPIALVLTRTLDDESRAAVAEVRRAAADALEVVRDTRGVPESIPPLLDELTRVDAHALGELPIALDEVLVVPRLHAVGDPSAFERAITAKLAASGRQPIWVHAPR